MKNLKTIEAKVKAILQKNEDARNDDMTLYLIVCNTYLKGAGAIGIFLPPDTPVASPAYPFFSAVVAVVASVTVALLGGLLPALKAAKLEPALALR